MYQQAAWLAEKRDLVLAKEKEEQMIKMYEKQQLLAEKREDDKERQVEEMYKDSMSVNSAVDPEIEEHREVVKSRIISGKAKSPVPVGYSFFFKTVSL